MHLGPLATKRDAGTGSCARSRLGTAVVLRAHLSAALHDGPGRGDVIAPRQARPHRLDAGMPVRFPALEPTERRPQEDGFAQRGRSGGRLWVCPAVDHQCLPLGLDEAHRCIQVRYSRQLHPVTDAPRQPPVDGQARLQVLGVAAPPVFDPAPALGPALEPVDVPARGRSSGSSPAPARGSSPAASPRRSGEPAHPWMGSTASALSCSRACTTCTCATGRCFLPGGGLSVIVAWPMARCAFVALGARWRGSCSSMIPAAGRPFTVSNTRVCFPLIAWSVFARMSNCALHSSTSPCACCSRIIRRHRLESARSLPTGSSAMGPSRHRAACTTGQGAGASSCSAALRGAKLTSRAAGSSMRPFTSRRFSAMRQLTSFGRPWWSVQSSHAQTRRVTAPRVRSTALPTRSRMRRISSPVKSRRVTTAERTIAGKKAPYSVP